MREIPEVDHVCQFVEFVLFVLLMFGMLLYFQFVNKLLAESLLILHALQEASDILVIPILKLLGVQGYISDRHRYRFKTILHLRM